MSRDLSTQAIKIIVGQINSKCRELYDKGKETHEVQKKLKQQFPEFEEKYPKLFSMSCSKNFDENKFLWMMSLKTQIDTGEKTSHDVSIGVGQRLAKEYVYSKLDMTKEPTIN
jgi:hypothetical protein